MSKYIPWSACCALLLLSALLIAADVRADVPVTNKPFLYAQLKQLATCEEVTPCATGDTPEQVIAHLGQPTARWTYQHPKVSGETMAYGDYAGYGILLTFRNGHLYYIAVGYPTFLDEPD